MQQTYFILVDGHRSVIMNYIYPITILTFHLNTIPVPFLWCHLHAHSLTNRMNGHEVSMTACMQRPSISFTGHAQTKQELRQNLRQKLLEWVPSVKQLILGKAQQSAVPYIGHKISAVMIDKKEEEQLEVSSIQQLLEKCKDGRRAIIYGEAGSGKTTVLQNIASWWLAGQMAVLQAYDFVFLIPLRLVQSHSIVDIICLDCQLLPKEFGDSLSRTLAMNSKVLLLLDSYEDLQAVRTEELTKLISRDLYAQATVFITSRPESQVTQINPALCIRANLENFSEEDVKEYIACYLKRDPEIFSDMKKKFGMDFLTRPINLALACYMYTSLGIKGLHHVSQTQLFNQIVLQLLTVYIKKESHVDILLGNITDLFSRDDGKLKNVKLFFKEICRLCYMSCQPREGATWLSTVGTDISVNDFMNFGLFFRGPKPNTIDLPHRLFQEFLAAVYLVRNQPDWEAQLKAIERECQDFGSTSSTRHYLGDVLRRMGLENVVKFIVGLSATPGQKLGSLFVVKQQDVKWDNIKSKQSVYSYELQLLRECTADGVNSVAEALINAPVITVSGDHSDVKNSGAEQLVDMWNPEQSRQFLAKAYGCEVKENLSGHVTMSRANDVWPFVCDSFVVRCLQKFRCTALEMGPEMFLVHSRIPVDLFPLLTSGVSRYLHIEDCKLLPGGDVERRDIANKTKSVAPKVKLWDVSGRRQLGDCHVRLANVEDLELWYCGDVNIWELSQTFTQLWRLRVGSGRLVYSYDWKPVNEMKELELCYCGEAKLCVLRQLCPQLTGLVISGCQVSWPDVRSQWRSLQKLHLLSLDEVKLCQVAQLSPCLEELRICGKSSTDACAVCVDVAGQLQSLQTLRLDGSYLVQRGRRLTEEEARQTLTHIYPSATIHIDHYQVTQCTEFTLNTSSCL